MSSQKLLWSYYHHGHHFNSLFLLRDIVVVGTSNGFITYDFSKTFHPTEENKSSIADMFAFFENAQKRLKTIPK
jgi:hypothetical protein